MIKLVCVTSNNNNKFYYMEDLHNGSFKVTYGRVGASETTLTYPISDWNKKYKEKINDRGLNSKENYNAYKKNYKSIIPYFADMNRK